MQPGRELDALVFEKVFGQEPVALSDAQTGRPWEIPEYSTNIAAAWSVVEKFRKDCEDVGGFCIKGDKGGWSIHTGYYADWKASEAESLPHAICLAALKASGWEG